MDNRPIGVFDSGLGGLTVLKELKKLLPFEDFIYLGDTARVPYGNRSKQTIINFSKEDAKFLISKGVKILIVACNTAAAFSIETLKEDFSLPIFDVISSGSKSAAKETRNKKVGVLATRGTAKSGSYLKKLQKIDKEIKVTQVAAPLLVPLVEEGELGGELLNLVLKKYLRSFENLSIDTLILGCTHYPVISGEIQKWFGDKVSLINPGVGTAEEVSYYLSVSGMSNAGKNFGKTNFYVTDLNDNFVSVGEMFLHEKIADNILEVKLI